MDSSVLAEPIVDDLAPSTEDIIDRFITKGFHNDVDRYRYKTRLVGAFLQCAEMDSLRSQHVSSHVKRECILLDDRNNNNVPPELMKAVSKEDPVKVAR